MCGEKRSAGIDVRHSFQVGRCAGRSEIPEGRVPARPGTPRPSARLEL